MSWLKEGKSIAKQILKENPNTIVKSALLGGDDRIISFAIGTPENPMDWEDIKKEDEAEYAEDLKDIRRQNAQRAEENNKRRKRFENWLKDGHFKYQEFEGSKMGFVKVNGVYNNSDVKEHSYFIINPNIGDALHLFKHFGQQAFIFAIKDKDTNTMTYQLWTRDDINENYKKVEEKKNVTSNAEAEDFFSAIHDFKFNIPFDYFNESIKDLRTLLNNCSQNDDFYKRLEKQVYNKIASGWNSWLNRCFMYETIEHRKERLKRVNIISEKQNTRLKSALFGADDRILSFAIGTPENPMGKDVGAEENNKLKQKFEKNLKADNYKFVETKTKGGYVKIKGEYQGNIEHSYFIINPQIDEMKSLFKWYKQDGFVFAFKDKESGSMIYQFWKMDDNGNYYKLSEEKDVKTDIDVDRFFSSLKDFKFNIDFKELNKTAEEAHEDLNECVKNGNYYRCLESQVYGDFVHFLNRIMNRKLMYETVEQKRKREKRINH